MMLVRDVFQARYGMGDELVALFKAAQQHWTTHFANRILTDASGPFFTVVVETEVENLAAWERLTADIFGMPDFGEWFGRIKPLVESGRREFYNIEA